MLSKKQQQILAFPHTSYDALICDGAIRSGKTSVMSISFIDWAMGNFNKAKFAFCGKTVEATVKNIIEPYLETAYSKKYICRFSRSRKTLTIKKGRTTNTFHIYGGKDESSYQLIQGITLGGVMLDEVALMPRSFVEQALARCSLDGSKYWFNCNPSTPKHWFNVEWILKAKEKNALHIHFLLEDNPGLSKSIITRYKRDYVGVFYNRYILGLWVVAEGAIYRYFAENKEKFIIKKNHKLIGDIKYINIGVDFGGNGSEHAFVATGITGTNDLIVLKAQSVPATGIDVDELINMLIRFCAEIQQEYKFIDGIYCDSAEQTIINTIRNRIEYSVYNSIKNIIVDRIRATCLLMKTGRLYLLDGECQDLIDGFCEAVWSDKKMHDERLDDKTSNIDILDAFEYSFEYDLRRLIEHD